MTTEERETRMKALGAFNGEAREKSIRLMLEGRLNELYDHNKAAHVIRLQLAEGLF